MMVVLVVVAAAALLPLLLRSIITFHRSCSLQITPVCALPTATLLSS